MKHALNLAVKPALSPAARTNAHPPPAADAADGEADANANANANADTHTLIDALLRSYHGLQSCLLGLGATRSDLRREAELGARRLHGIVHELAFAADSVGDGRLSQGIRSTAPAAARQPSLSGREREVLQLLTGGSRSPCIALRLGICNATVEVHRRNIMRKLNLHTIAGLTKYAVREGLTSL